MASVIVIWQPSCAAAAAAVAAPIAVGLAFACAFALLAGLSLVGPADPAAPAAVAADLLALRALAERRLELQQLAVACLERPAKPGENVAVILIRRAADAAGVRASSRLFSSNPSALLISRV